jgi:hypothetical protein
MTPNPTASSSGEHRRSELAELRRELRDKQNYLDDNDDLWAEIALWLYQSHDAPVGSLRTKVRSRLAELQEDPQHKLYDHPGVDDPEAAFPDACENCPHYGVECPVLARYTTKKTLERHFDEADDDTELQGRLSQYAADHHCEVMQTAISEWESGYSQFLERGERLRMELNAAIKGIDLAETAPELAAALNAAAGADAGAGDAPSATETAVADVAAGGAAMAVADGRGEGPPPEDAERVAEISQSIMADDEEDDS